MIPDSIPPVAIPAADYSRLEQVAAQALEEQHPVAAFLMSELRRAEVCDELPPGTVAVNRWVTYRIDRGWPPESRKLVCPEDFKNADAQLSILSPIGAALLGLRTGSRMPYLSIEGVFHVASVDSLDPPLGVLSLLQLPRKKPRPPINPYDPNDPDDPGPAAA